MKRIWFDFNSMNQNGLAHCSSRFYEGSDPLRVGDKVLLHDGDGNTCEGDIVYISSGWMVIVQLSISTWMDGPINE